LLDSLLQEKDKIMGTSLKKYKFPLLMSGILGGIFTFYYTFSSVNQARIKYGSRKFTHAPATTFEKDE